MCSVVVVVSCHLASTAPAALAVQQVIVGYVAARDWATVKTLARAAGCVNQTAARGPSPAAPASGLPCSVQLVRSGGSFVVRGVLSGPAERLGAVLQAFQSLPVRWPSPHFKSMAYRLRWKRQRAKPRTRRSKERRRRQLQVQAVPGVPGAGAAGQGGPTSAAAAVGEDPQLPPDPPSTGTGTTSAPSESGPPKNKKRQGKRGRGGRKSGEKKSRGQSESKQTTETTPAGKQQRSKRRPGSAGVSGGTSAAPAAAPSGPSPPPPPPPAPVFGVRMDNLPAIARAAALVRACSTLIQYGSPSTHACNTHDPCRSLFFSPCCSSA